MEEAPVAGLASSAQELRAQHLRSLDSELCASRRRVVGLLFPKQALCVRGRGRRRQCCRQPAQSIMPIIIILAPSCAARNGATPAAAATMGGSCCACMAAVRVRAQHTHHPVVRPSLIKSVRRITPARPPSARVPRRRGCAARRASKPRPAVRSSSGRGGFHAQPRQRHPTRAGRARSAPRRPTRATRPAQRGLSTAPGRTAQARETRSEAQRSATHETNASCA
jgi:hypothetical protein